MTMMTPTVRMLDRFADRKHELERLPLIKLGCLDVPIQFNAINQLHGVERNALGDATVIHAGDVRMLEAGRQFYFALEARLRPGRPKSVGG